MKASELDKHYTIALKEIGVIEPWQDAETGGWTFSHPAYDLEAEGDTPEECAETYRRWLKGFIEERLASNLAPTVEKFTSGRGGYRGGGRPKGTTKGKKDRIYLPADIAAWLRTDQDAKLGEIRKMMSG